MPRRKYLVCHSICKCERFRASIILYICFTAARQKAEQKRVLNTSALTVIVSQALASGPQALPESVSCV
jgi:hypothetical protein